MNGKMQWIESLSSRNFVQYNFLLQRLDWLLSLYYLIIYKCYSYCNWPIYLVQKLVSFVSYFFYFHRASHKVLKQNSQNKASYAWGPDWVMKIYTTVGSQDIHGWDFLGQLEQYYLWYFFSKGVDLLILSTSSNSPLAETLQTSLTNIDANQ